MPVVVLLSAVVVVRVCFASWLVLILQRREHAMGSAEIVQLVLKLKGRLKLDRALL